MEGTSNFVDCLVCDVTLCPVTLAPQSEDEKLLDIFCHYFKLSPKDVEKVYDERVGFPFCDDCRERTLLSLSQFHDQLTSIQNEIIQLVTNAWLSIVNIVGQNSLIDSNDSSHGQYQVAGNYSKEAIAGIRKSITDRLNSRIPIIRPSFQGLGRQIDAGTQTSEENEDLNESDELLWDVDPSSIVEIVDNAIVKDEPFSPSVSCKEVEESDEESDVDTLEFEGAGAEEQDSSSSSFLAKFLVSRKIGTKLIKRPKPESCSSSNSKLDVDEEEEDSDGDGPSKSKKSPVKNAPQKGSELKKTMTRKKWNWGTGDPKDRERYRRDKADPVIEVEPNLFRRKESGWSFRKEQVDGVEVYVCLAKGCHRKYGLRVGIMQHVTLEHINNKREKCGKCDKAFWKKEQLDKHICVPQRIPGTTFCKKTQSFGNGQYIYDGIWPFHEVDVVKNGGCDMKCGTCGALTREKRRMQEHIRSTHLDRPKFPCEICNKTFASNSALSEHLPTHSDTKEAVCDKCGEFFKNKKTLRGHVRTKHERVVRKSFKCDFPNCNRGFTEKYNLSRHQRTAGHRKPAPPEQPQFLIDPIICPLCDKKFVREKTYELHRKTCLGKKEYFCPICQKKSFNAQALRLHMAFKHKDEYMNYPEGRLRTDPNKTADEQIAKMKIINRKGDVKQREKKRAVALQQRLEKLKQLKQNQSTSS